jgi:hypothetical protein
MSNVSRQSLLAARERCTGDRFFVTQAGKPYSISVIRRTFASKLASGLVESDR